MVFDVFFALFSFRVLFQTYLFPSFEGPKPVFCAKPPPSAF